jgi:hypothetical protein
MDLPARVIVFAPVMEIKNKPATLVSVSEHGYYELRMEFSGRRHTVLAPILQTGLVFNDPEEEFETVSEIER